MLSPDYDKDDVATFVFVHTSGPPKQHGLCRQSDSGAYVATFGCVSTSRTPNKGGVMSGIFPNVGPLDGTIDVATSHFLFISATSVVVMYPICPLVDPNMVAVL